MSDLAFTAELEPFPSQPAWGGELGREGQIAPATRDIPAIRLAGISKTYALQKNDVHALRGIDLDIHAGEVFGIIGRSGAGKSSLIRLINRLEQPTSGEVLINGQDIGLLSEEGLVGLRRKIGMIFQHFNLLATKTVFDNIALPLVVAGFDRREIAQRVAEVVKLVGLEGKEKTYPGRLSGGQKQRVGIARALVSRPEILLCDEATSALDPETTLSILRLLKDVNRRLGLTIVLITHEMSVIREICDRVVVLSAGEIVEKGEVWQVFGAPKDEATKALLEPLERNLPADFLARISAKARHPDSPVLLELRSLGKAPNLAELNRGLRHGAEIISANIEQIQGHSIGQLVLLLASKADAENLLAQYQTARILGYVDPSNG